jgi:tetratricopeptide (TPR) repeat protein
VGIYCPTDSDEARRLYNEAVQTEDGGDLAAARDLYVKALELDPTFCDAWDNLGRVHRWLGELDQAISCYHRSLEILPGNPTALMNLGVAYQVGNQMDQAMETYDELVRSDPGNPEGYYGRAQVYEVREHWEQALAQYEEAEWLYQQQSSEWLQDTRINMARCHVLMGNTVEARDLLQIVYPSRPDEGLVNLLLGYCYLNDPIYDREKAAGYLARAQELGMDVPEEWLKE